MSKNKGQTGQQRPNQANQTGQQQASKINPQAGQTAGHARPTTPAQTSHKAADARNPAQNRDGRNTR